MTALVTVFAFEVTVKNPQTGALVWPRTINARTPGQAKREFFYSLQDSWPDIPWTAMRCRKVGGPLTSAAFTRNATYRGLPGVKCGDRVKVGKAVGVIVGHNSSANFNVLFDDDSPEFAGLVLNVHPQELQFPEVQS